ncbi:MAG: hypothetical protein Q8Q13_02095 [bacterium]|nr:hypothetical protein [bacterium]
MNTTVAPSLIDQLQTLMHLGKIVETTDHLFVSQNEARATLINRKKDAELKKRVWEKMSPEARVIISKFSSPRAMLFRQVATPTHEILRFLRIAKHMKLNPVILEYYGDKFVSAGNPYKRALGKMPIYQHTGIDGRDNVKYHNVVDFNAYTGKPLSDVKCKSGESMIDFHHKLLDKMSRLNISTHCADATPWFQCLGGIAGKYYEEFLALFIRDAILFEYFEPTESEQKFVRETMVPAFQSVTAQFGMPPLIVRLVPKNKEGRRLWESYPKKIEPLISA